MRILFLTNFYPPTVFGGYELRCADVVEGLVRRGHEVLVVTSRHGQAGNSVDGFVHRVLQSYWDIPRKPKGQEAFIQTQLTDNLQLDRLIREFQPNVVSVWNMLGIAYSLARTVQESGVPALFHVDDTWLLREDEFWTQYGISNSPDLNLMQGDAASVVLRDPPRDHPLECVFISKFRRSEHVSAGLDVADAPVIYGGIDAELFAAVQAKHFRTGQRLRLLFVGALTEAKGVTTLLHALAAMPDDARAQASLTCVGEATPQKRDELNDLVGSLALEEQVTFIGSVARENMAAIYKEHDVFVFPSPATEGFPLVLLEAMAAGVPVISTINGGQREYLKDGENAFVIPAGDPQPLATCLAQAVRSPDRLDAVAEAGWEMTLSRFSIEIMVNKTEALLEQVAGRGAFPC